MITGFINHFIAIYDNSINKPLPQGSQSLQILKSKKRIFSVIEGRAFDSISLPGFWIMSKLISQDRFRVAHLWLIIIQFF